jgi:hypothetical protein
MDILMRQREYNYLNFVVIFSSNSSIICSLSNSKIGGKTDTHTTPKKNSIIAEQRGITSLAKFWGKDTCYEVIENHGKADLITATNVFAHVDNIEEFLRCAKATLSDKGVLVIEFPYLVDFIQNKEYDTTYFEHLSYVSITPIERLCERVGLKLFDVEKQNIHGGTTRLSICHPNAHEVTQNVADFIKYEADNGFMNFEKYLCWSKDINDTIKDFSTKLLELKLKGYTISGFGASAKGNTLLNSCKITTDLMDYIADETPEKIGKFSPTTGIPIVNKQTIIDKPTDYIVILAWNFQEEIIAKLRPIYDGEFIIPVPEFKIIN